MLDKRDAPSIAAIGAYLLILIIIIAAVGAFLYQNRSETSPPEDYVNAHLLVDAEWILAHLDDPDLRLIDVRSQEEYDRGHIEESVQLDLESIRATVDGVRGMVASKEVVEGVFGGLGLTRQVTVVLYDTGDSLDASRVFWTLEYYGHEDARILNGGWSKWVSDDNPVSLSPSDIEQVVYEATVNSELVASAEDILENLENPEVVILDVRSPAEFNGVDVRAKRGGHIPGSVNVEWTRAINLDDTFKSASELLEMYRDAGVIMDREVITSCQTGHRAAHSYFTMRLLGYDVRLYDGSWEEWGNRDDLPLE